MPSTEKIEKVAALRERIQGSQALILTEYRGLSVHDATELRHSLADQARFAVAKNTLLLRAATEAGLQGLEHLLSGPTAVAFVQGDVVATAKRLVEAARRFPALVIKGGFVEGKVLTAEEARALAELESREVMLSKVAGMLKSEMSRAASMFQALQSRFVGLMEALRDKLPAEAGAQASAEPGTATEAPQAETDHGQAETESGESQSDESQSDESQSEGEE